MRTRSDLDARLQSVDDVDDWGYKPLRLERRRRSVPGAPCWETIMAGCGSDVLFGSAR